MTTRFHTGVIAAGVLASVAGFAADARGQVRTWNSASNGNWNLAANWAPADIPDNGVESAVISDPGAFWVTIPAGYSPSISMLTIADGSGSVVRNDNGNFYVGGIHNEEIVQIGTGGPNGTYLNALGAVNMSGSGIVRLVASGNLDTAVMLWTSNSASQYFVQEATHGITGSGNIYARLDSAGLVSADINGAVLQLTSQNKTNTGLMRATGGGILRFNAIGVTNTGGTILANGGAVQIVSSTVDGGALTNAAGSISITGTSNFGSVTSSGLVAVEDNATLRITGTGIVNNGEITVNSGGPNQSSLRPFGGTRLLTGSGTVTLNATANLETAVVVWTTNSATETFTQTNGHTLRGSGNVYAVLDNSGLVNADQNTKILRLSSQNKANQASGVMRASGGGVLDVNGITITNSGVIEALTGSSVQLSSSYINGGTLNASGSGLFRTFGTSYLDSLSNNAPLFITNNATLRGLGTVVNNNVITVSDGVGANATYLNAQGGVFTLNGTGTVFMNANPNLDTAILSWTSNTASETFVQGAAHTIRGTGNIYAGLTNNGLVHADQSGKILQLTSQGKVNNATFRASNGGQLAISSIGVTNTGSIEALNGSTIQVNSSSISGGTLNAAGTGLFRTTGTSVLSNLTNNAPLFITNNSTIRGTGTLVNNNLITLNETAGINATYLASQGGILALNGSGTVLLNASPNLDTAILSWTSNSTSETILQGAAHTIRGTGNINVALTNNGLVHADQSGAILQLTSQGKINNAIFRASNGGQLAISSIAVTNAGTIEALTGSTVQINSASISGGTLSASGSGLFRTGGTSSITNLTNNAPIFITNNATLRGTGTILNNSVITVNETAGVNATYLTSQGGALTFNGTGSLVLNASANFDTAILQWTSNSTSETMVQSASHTIAGNGNIYVRLINSGILSPGVTIGSAGRLNFGSQPAQLNATSRYVCNINGTAAAQYDRLTGSASIVLNGTLAVQFGYQPNISDQFDVVGAPYTGRFTRLELPKGYYVEYLPSIVRVVFSGCMGDWDQDGDVDSDDVNQFFADFENGESDIDSDGDTDSDDIIEFFGRFESGC